MEIGSPVTNSGDVEIAVKRVTYCGVRGHQWRWWEQRTDKCTDCGATRKLTEHGFIDYKEPV